MPKAPSPRTTVRDCTAVPTNEVGAATGTPANSRIAPSTTRTTHPPYRYRPTWNGKDTFHRDRFSWKRALRNTIS